MTTFSYPTKTKTKSQTDLNSTQNLVDPSWETIDPTPDIHSLFRTFDVKFFAGRLSCVELEWSVRMYQCAGICYSRKSRVGMACVIRLSEPLLKLRSRKDLVETLLHEMIHAWNFIRGIMEENGGHGQNFLAKMHEINRLAGTHISVYHSFHDEVDLYKNHWWRCNGKCQDRKPYYGFVKRTCNRVPSPNDLWWKQHEQTCGGKFIKVKEPEKVENKKKGKENKTKAVASSSTSKISKKSPPAADIRKFFKPSSGDDDTPIKKVPGPPPAPTARPSGGNSLGGKGSGRSRLLDMFDDKKVEIKPPKKRKLHNGAPGTSSETIVLDDSFASTQRDNKSFHDSIRSELDDDDIILIDDEFDDDFLSSLSITSKPIDEPKKPVNETCNCPVCNVPIQLEKVNEHLDQCLAI